MVDDFDVIYPNHPHEQGVKVVVAPADDPRNKRKVAEVIKDNPITVITPSKRTKQVD